MCCEPPGTAGTDLEVRETDCQDCPTSAPAKSVASDSR